MKCCRWMIVLFIFQAKSHDALHLDFLSELFKEDTNEKRGVFDWLDLSASPKRTKKPKHRSPLEGEYIEGDIIPDSDGTIHARASSTVGRIWPNNIVYYVLDKGFDRRARRVFKKAVEMFHSHTCLKFVEGKGDGNYANIKSEGTVCASRIGYAGSGPQLVLLGVHGYPNCIGVGLIMHELMHTIGFRHEQTRKDRDEYIRIHWHNIERNKEREFMKSNDFDDLNTPYDYTSVMHYDDIAFSKDGKTTTMTPISAGWKSEDLGKSQRLGVFSETDLQKIKELYECDN